MTAHQESGAKNTNGAAIPNEETRQLRRLVDVTLKDRRQANIENARTTLMHVVVKLEKDARRWAHIRSAYEMMGTLREHFDKALVAFVTGRARVEQGMDAHEHYDACFAEFKQLATTLDCLEECMTAATEPEPKLAVLKGGAS